MLKRKIKLSYLLAALFLLVVAISSWVGWIPHLLFYWYLLLSLTSFVLYAWDKSAAKKSSSRVSESTLHLSSLLGGWPGALVGQQLFRHKTIKQPFRYLFWVTVLLNLLLYIWLYLPGGARVLDSLLALFH